MGVELRLDSVVTKVTADAVGLASGDEIPTATAVWVAGVRASPLADTRGLVAWLFLHLVYLVLSNRANVVLNWLWSYVTHDRGARLIVEASRADPDIARPDP